MSLPAPLYNLTTNPCMESVSGSATVWTNLCLNPTFGTNVTGYTAVSGTGGTSTVVQGSVTPIPAYSGTYFAKQTWTVGTTAVSGGLDFASVSPGTGLLYVSAYVAVSGVATQRLQFSFTGTATVSTVSNAAVVAASGNWVRVEAFLNVTAAGTVIPHLYAVAGTSALNWAVSSSLLLDSVMIIHGSAVSVPAFSGDTADVGNVLYSWTGTAGASTSTWSSGIPVGTSSLGSAVVYQEPAYAQAQTASLAVQCTGSATPGATLSTVTFAAGTATVSVYVYWPVGSTPVATTLTCTGGLAGTHTLTPSAGIWTQLHVTGTATTTATTFKVTAAGTPPAGTTFFIDSMNAVRSSSTAYFDGNTPPDSNYYYSWTGAANASTTMAEYRGVWIDVLTGPPCPRTQITVSGLGSTPGLVQVTRTEVDNSETWTVPGWASKSVVDTDTGADYAVPLGRDVTYTMYFNGQQINQITVNVPSTNGWIQDPYDPSSAMPINTTRTDDSILTLAAGSFQSRTSVSNKGSAQVMGSKRQHSISGQRMKDTGLLIILNAWQNDTSDNFKQMTDATILLVRGLPSWGSMPGLMYTDGSVAEFAVNRARVAGNHALTQWTITGDLCQPVSRAPVAGQVTNDQMQTALAGTTYNTIKGRSGSKRYIDIKADPLSL